jgi:hypothetical protein
MAVSPQKRRPKGSLPALKARLWRVFLCNVEFVEDPAQDIEVRLRASTAAVQAGLTDAPGVESLGLAHHGHAHGRMLEARARRTHGHFITI